MKGKILTGILLSMILALALVSAATFTASINPSTFLDSDSVNSTTLTVTNNPSQPPLNISFDPFSILGEGSYVVQFPGGSITNISTSKTLTLTPSSSIVYSNFKLGKPYSGTLTVKNTDNASDSNLITINLVKSFCDYGETGTNLSISSVDITNNGEGDEDSWMPLDEIELKIKVDNNNADEDDKIDTSVEVGLYDSNGKEQLDLDKISFRKKIKGGDNNRMTVTFEVPADLGVDESSYNLYIKAYQKGNEDEICTSRFDSEFSRDISVDREDNTDRMVIADNFQIEPSPVSCGNDVILTARIVNIGDEDQDKVKVSLFNRELGINLYQVINDMEQGDEQNAKFSFKIPGNATEKTYKFDLTNKYSFNDNYNPDEDAAYDDTSETFPITLSVQGCASPITKNAAITASLETPEENVKAGNEITIKATIRNTGDETTTYIMSLEGNEAFSTLQNINPSTLTLDAGQSKDALITLKLNNDASGEYTFNIKASFDTKEVSQPVSLSVTGKAAGITGSAIIESIKGNWFIWVIVLINIILIIAIIVVAVRISKA